ncbi:type III-B CRISPR module-associated protein Cmr3 [Herpetosiphon geysericola]|uniref:type III-B CRISPR module-associated protein Cmr3 n=1 Tax=Herpetosiphon geysericola TaxID=70996 RepID=UPI0006C91A96|nr:type III-B CRISPR module-associated protein Cmr3 [Herpetosiphon geysericola]
MAKQSRRERHNQKQQAKKQMHAQNQIADPIIEHTSHVQVETYENPPNTSCETPTQQTWLIEPRDPLIVRDGRPFNNTPGARAYTQSFPPPSVLAGVIRSQTAYASKLQFTRNSDDNRQQGNKLQPIQIYGPLLFKLPNPNKEKDEPEFLCHAPADALLFEPEAKTKAQESDNQQSPPTRPWLCRLVPIQVPERFVCDFNELGLVGLVKADPRKPAKDQPQFWYWEHFLHWLQDPEGLINKTNPQASNPKTIAVGDLGIKGLPIDQRTHVQIDSESQSAEDGRLFQTRGLSFTQTNEQQLAEARRLALYVHADYRDTTGLTIPQPSIAPLGGERRLAHWAKTDQSLPACDQVIVDAIVKANACRVILLTPAMFSEGYRPTWLFQDPQGVQPTLAAIAIKRAQVISGWDLAIHKPKPTRRLAPAGTVLFLKFAEKENSAAIEAWVRNYWMQCISDEEQDRRDGFGLAVFGTWDGEFAEIKGETK